MTDNTLSPSPEKEKRIAFIHSLVNRIVPLTTGLPSLASTLGTSGLSNIPLPQFFGSEKSGVILEFGSAYTKCGFAGECAPRFFVPAIYTIHSQTLTSKPGRRKDGQPQRLSLYARVGKQAASKDEWKEAIEMHLNAIYFQYLQTNPRERRVIVCENVLFPVNFKEALSSLLFNKFKVPAVHFFTSQLTSLLPLSKTTGLVVDCGFSETRVLPVVEGVPLIHALSVAPISMASVLVHLRSLILDYGRLKNLNTGEILPTIPINFVEHVLIKACFVNDAPSPSQPTNRKSWPQFATPSLKSVSKTNANPPIKEKEDKKKEKKDYTSRDPYCSISINTEFALLIPQSVRSKAADLLFDGDEEENSIPSLILDSLSKSPPDNRFELAESIVLIGGTCSIIGFRKRLLLELKRQLSASNTLDFKGLENQFEYVKSSFNANYLGWLGGAMLGAVPEALPNIIQKNTSGNANQPIPQTPPPALKVDSNEGNSSTATSVGGTTTLPST